MNSYKIAKDEEYHLAETTGAVYEAIRMLELKCSFIEIASKLNIIQEFKLERESIKDEIGIKEYYEGLSKILFLEECKENFKDLNLAEINRAKTDFFSLMTKI